MVHERGSRNEETAAPDATEKFLDPRFSFLDPVHVTTV
jgi:hypothetical protein